MKLPWNLPGRAWSISRQNPWTTATETALCTTPFLPESFQTHLCCGFKISHVASSTVDMVQTVRKTSLTGGGQRHSAKRQSSGGLGSRAIWGLHSVRWLGLAQGEVIHCLPLNFAFPQRGNVMSFLSSSFQIHETIETINQLKTQREFMLSFARDPQGFINDWLQSQCRDLKVENLGKVQRDLGP